MDYQSYQLTVAAGEDIVVTGQGPGGRAFFNTLGVVEVPEPATMALLAFGGVAALIRRRRG